MTGTQRRCFIQEKEFGPAVRLHYLAMPSAKFRAACNPASNLPGSNDSTRIVVQHAAIPHNQAATGQRNDVAERRDPVLQWRPIHVTLTSWSSNA